MKNKNKVNFFLNWLKTKEFFVYSLLFILIGIFLLPKVAFLSSVSEENILKLTNNERIKENLEPLAVNQLLADAAYVKGREILKAGIFQHNLGDKKFSEWIKDAGYNYSFAGENLAIDFVTSEGAMRAWLNSPTHKKNILNANFNETGIAVLNGKFNGGNTTLVIQIFGTPLINKPININLDTNEIVNSENLTVPRDADSGQSNNSSTVLISSINAPKGINFFQVLSISKIVSKIKLFYIKNTGIFKLIVSVFAFTVLLLFVDHFGRWTVVKNFLTPKNRQLRLPLK